MRTSAPWSSSTTSPGSMPEYQPTQGPQPANHFGLRAARIATSTRSRRARQQAVAERAGGDNGDRVDSRDKADNGDKVDSSDRRGAEAWTRRVCEDVLEAVKAGRSP